MNNLKKLLSVLVVVAMIATIALPAFAAEGTYTYTAEAQKLNDLGLYKGISTTTFNPDLGTALNRETGTVMLLRVFGLEKDAEAITDADATLAKFTDAATISSWAKNAVAYAVKNGLVQGYPDGTFGPKVALNGKAYATLILRQLGFTPDYEKAPAELADKGGLTPDEATKFASKDLIKDDLVGISFGTLSAKDKDGKKVIENLVAAKVVDETAAVDAGLLAPAATPTPAPVASALDIASAATLSSKIIEVSLNTAAKAEDVAAATFKVADASAKEVAVTKAELAAYDADSKTVLVTLESNTTAGSLYTLTCGTQTAKFGGKAPETTKPEVDTVKATDYNEVKVTFTEPIVLEGATITAAEKYGSKASLSISNMKYDGNDTIVLTTADQKGSTLYGIKVENVVDFSGNKMDADSDKTFVGIKKNTDDLKIAAISADDYNHVIVRFATKIDPATVSAATFTVAESSGSKTSIPVASAAQLTSDQVDDDYSYDSDNNAAKLTDDEKDEVAERSVMLTLDGSMKKSTLYKGTVAGGIKTLYGKALSTDSADTSKTFVGKAKPTDALVFGTTPVTVDSNTQITVAFAEKVDKALVETVANYAIAESYGSKTALAVTKAEIDGTKSVKLTVASMKNILYKITVTGIKDIYGNAIKTSDDKNITTFVGKKVADKIDSIVSIERVSDTKIRVEFNRNVGSNATDVSLYSIDNSIGYPQKAELAGDDVANYKAKVELTIPKTVQGKIYKLTVKGLVNSDGVAMASDDKVEKTFVGKGSDASKAKIVAVTAIDARTIQIYFDRAADDKAIKGVGRIWDGDPGQLINGNTLGLDANCDDDTGDVGDIANLQGVAHTVWQDATDDNILVVRFNVNMFKKANSKATDKFQLVALSTKVDSDDDANIVEFGYNDDDVGAPELIDVMADNNQTLKLFFSEPVKFDNTKLADIKFYSTESGTTAIKNDVGANLAVTGAYKITDTEWKLTLNGKLLGKNTNVPSNKSVFLYISRDTSVPANNSLVITDTSKFVGVKANDDEKYRSVEFGVNDDNSDSDAITDVDTYMPNKKTIEIYYPERMNKAALGDPTWANSVKNTANYKFVGTESGGGVVAGGVSIVATTAEYDEDTMKATLFLNNNIDNITVDGKKGTKIYLAISEDVKNETGTNNIDKDQSNIFGAKSALIIELAPSSEDVPKPAISDVTVADDRTSMDIKFDSKISLPDGIDAGAQGFAAAGTITPANLLLALNITAQFEGQTASAKITANDIAKAADINADHDTITVTFAVKLAEGSSGLVNTKLATANKILNKQGAGADVTDDDGSEVSFGVAPSLFPDTVGPKIVSAALTDAALVATDWDGIGDVLTLTFSELVSLKANDDSAGLDGIQLSAADVSAITGVTVTYGVGSVVTAAVSGNKITLTISGLALTTGIVDGNAFDGATGLVEDNSGNDLVAGAATL